MDGAERAFAAPSTIVLTGRKFTITGTLARHYGAISQRMLEMKPDPVKRGKEVFDAFAGDVVAQEIQARVWADKAMDVRYVRRHEMADWLNNTWEGCAFYLWLSMQEHHPDVTEAEVLAMLLEESEDVVRRIIDDSRESDGDDKSQEEAEAEAASEVRDNVVETITRASGEDWRGNSTGSSPTPQGTSETTETDTAQSTGG